MNGHEEMTFRNFDAQEIKRLRAEMAAAKASSHTTINYQNDLLTLLDTEGSASPGDVIEVGCYLGGLTTQLAYVCAKLGKRLHVVDINIQYMTTAMYHMNRLGVGAGVSLFTDGLESYLSRQPFQAPPYLMVIDGDHSYSGVISDINAIKRYQPQTRRLVFHDFSLRYTTEANQELNDVRVDRAVREGFGAANVRGFGILVRAEGPLAVTPQPDGHYHELGQHEGALIHLA